MGVVRSIRRAKGHRVAGRGTLLGSAIRIIVVVNRIVLKWYVDYILY